MVASLLWMDDILFAPRNETTVETVTFVGIYVGESTPSRASERCEMDFVR